MYKFGCSGREVDINKPAVFSKLAPDEVSELLCEDFNYISWMSEVNFNKLEGCDVVTILTTHPKLAPHFYPLMKEGLLEEYDWDYLLSKVPAFKALKNKYSN